MRRINYSTIGLISATVVFGAISKIIFDKIYITSKVVVDEEFHLSLGRAYCHHEFHKWHPKVTTLPGLYLLSSILLSPFDLCEIYWLRLTVFLFSVINIFLFYWILTLNNQQSAWKNVFSAINLGLLPPLYFFGHLYYTDVPSLSMILLLFIFSQKGNHYLASIFGVFAILFRQTNIIWVGMVFGCYILKEINAVHHNKPKSSNLQATPKEVSQLLEIFPKKLIAALWKTSATFWLNVLAYASLLLFFMVFVFLNNGIVVGDRTAHKATIHLPQLFYFSLFCLFFAWPFFIGEIRSFYRFIKLYTYSFVIAIIVCLVIVYFNTLVHPYMLADNRHYLFYVWNRFYGKYTLFRYLIVPVYLFSLFVIVSKVGNKKDIFFLFFFIFCTGVVLLTQRLLELRYFFIPFVLFRTHLKEVSTKSLIYEFLTHCILNVITLYLFFTKTILWADFAHPQRLTW